MTAQATQATATVTVHVPMRFATRGGRKLVISETPLQWPSAKIDNALLKALARAHRWRRRIEEGDYASITELAKAEGVNQSYACRLLRLTLLAPSIIEEILNGRQRPDLTLKALTRPVSVRWDQQLTAAEPRARGAILRGERNYDL